MNHECYEFIRQRAEIPVANIPTKKKWTHHKFLYRGPKKDVEQEYVYFGQTWAQKIGMFFCGKECFMEKLAEKTPFIFFIIVFF